MRCEDFLRRMHDRLDVRSALDSDEQLWQHAERCSQCRSRLRAWQQVASALNAAAPASSDRPARRLSASGASLRRPTGSLGLGWAGLALAACVLVTLVLQPEPPGRKAPVGQTRAVAQAEPARLQPAARPRHAAPPVHPALWWKRMRQREWLDQAMPAVHSVAEAVAPLGRSLLQAVVILAHGQGTRPS